MRPCIKTKGCVQILRTAFKGSRVKWRFAWSNNRSLPKGTTILWYQKKKKKKKLTLWFLLRRRFFYPPRWFRIPSFWMEFRPVVTVVTALALFTTIIHELGTASISKFPLKLGGTKVQTPPTLARMRSISLSHSLFRQLNSFHLSS